MTKTTYEVIGATPYDGHQPGETFDADLDEDQEDRAIERGAIRIVKGGHAKKQEVNDA
jgi:hypothetical protein